MLRLGEQEISGLHMGGSKINKAYLGESVVFGAEKPSRLPDGYTEVEYIQSDGGAAILTGIVPAAGNLDLRVFMDMELTAIASVGYSYFGCYYAAASGKPNGGVSIFRHASSGALYVRSSYNVNGAPTNMIAATDEIGRKEVVVDGPGKTAKVGEHEVQLSNVYVLNLPQLAVFGACNKIGTSAQTIIAGCIGRLYSCQIEKSGIRVRDYVPCIDPNGKAGAYDLVDGKFYGSATSTAFTPGSSV